MNTQLIRRLISHAFTQNMTIMKARSQWKTQAACHAEQDKIREGKMKTTHAHRQRSARPEQTRDRTLPQQDQNLEHACPNPNTNQHWAWNKTRVPGYEQTCNRARRRCARLEHTRNSALTRKQDKKGVLGLCHKTMNKTRPKWQNPDRNCSLMKS